MSRFVARPSLPRLLLLLLGSLLFVIGGFWIAGLLGAPPRPGHEWLGWITIGFFGPCTIAILPRLFDRGDQIVVDEQGIYWKRWSDQTIPWTELKDVRETAIERTRFICLDLLHPERFPSTTYLGKLASANRRLGFGDITINTAGTDKNFDDLRRAVFARWQSLR